MQISWLVVEAPIKTGSKEQNTYHLLHLPKCNYPLTVGGKTVQTAFCKNNNKSFPLEILTIVLVK